MNFVIVVVVVVFYIKIHESKKNNLQYFRIFWKSVLNFMKTDTRDKQKTKLNHSTRTHNSQWIAFFAVYLFIYLKSTLFSPNIISLVFSSSNETEHTHLIQEIDIYVLRLRLFFLHFFFSSSLFSRSELRVYVS